jgi:hypothetical protein
LDRLNSRSGELRYGDLTDQATGADTRLAEHGKGEGQQTHYNLWFH